MTRKHTGYLPISAEEERRAMQMTTPEHMEAVQRTARRDIEQRLVAEEMSMEQVFTDVCQNGNDTKCLWSEVWTGLAVAFAATEHGSGAFSLRWLALESESSLQAWSVLEGLRDILQVAPHERTTEQMGQIRAASDVFARYRLARLATKDGLRTGWLKMSRPRTRRDWALH